MEIKHNWVPLSETFYWWKCGNCGLETEHLKDNNPPEPSADGCEAKEYGSVFPPSCSC